MSDLVIQLDAVGKRYALSSSPPVTNISEGVRSVFERRKQRREFWALRDVSLELRAGESLGVIGSNGAGKSTLLKILAGITDPTVGTGVVHGRVSSLLEVGTGFHGDLSGRDNVYMNGALLGMKRVEIDRKFDEIVDFAGVEAFIDTPVKRYSSGMYVRLAFSVAAHVEPETMLVDEALSVGDQAFQEKCLRLMQRLADDGRTLVFISHNLAAVSRLCKQGLLLDHGQVVHQGAMAGAEEAYRKLRAPAAGSVALHSAKREGAGELRFSAIEITNELGGNELLPGQPVCIRVELIPHRPLAGEDVELQVEIGAPRGEALVTLSTRFDASRPLRGRVLSEPAAVVCRVDALPLRPGTYTLSMKATYRGEVADSVRGQVELSLLPTDYFGTGMLPAGGQGSILVRSAWTFDDAPADS